MKIAVIGYSGSGKSTLAKWLAERYGVDLLYLDRVQWLPNWQTRPQKEKEEAVEKFLDEHQTSGWVIDGNYFGLSFERRMAEADRIYLLRFNRFSCLFRVWKRKRTFRGKSRESMTEGCEEKIDAEFVRWILWQGRGKRQRETFGEVSEKYPQKMICIKNQRQLNAVKRNLFEKKGENVRETEA